LAEEWKKIKVLLKNNDLEAYIYVPYMEEEDPSASFPTIEDARKALQEAGVVSGIQEELLEKVFRDSLFDQEVLVAQGKAPKEGVDARLEYYFPTKKRFAPKEDEYGRIDYREVSFLINVSKGDKLCRRHPPTAGEPGLSVKGKEIPPKRPRDFLLPQGPNTEPAPGDANLLIASTNGCVSLNKSRLVEVRPKLEIKGDVDYSTGNIKFLGSLVIGGDVKSGFKVNVSEDLEIGGCIEDAEVEAGGDVLVKKGFIGHGKGVLRTGGDLTVKFVQNQEIHCEGDLVLGGELMHSKTFVGGDLIANNRKGFIIGGTVEVQGSVEAFQIGSVNATPTVVAVGRDFMITNRLKQIEEELEKIKENQEKVKKALYNLSRLKIKLKGNLPPEQQSLFERLQETNRHYPVYREKLLKEREDLEKELAKHKDAQIKVNHTLYPGVKIIIGNITRTITEKIERPVLREVNGEIVPVS